MIPLQAKKQAETAQELDAMLNSHRAWAYRLNKVLICGLEPSEEMVAQDAHLHCTLGNWLATRARELDLEDETYADLVTRHKNVHDLARAIVKMDQQGQKIEETIYDSFLEASEEFIGLIEATYDNLVASITALDPLTGAENRTLMFSRLEERQTQARERNHPAWVIMIDLDHFKSVNDIHGHELGDTVLKEFAVAVRDNIRADDLFFRYGGEEFLLCISNADVMTVTRVAERLRKAVEQISFDAPNGTSFSITASFGVAALDAEEQVSKAVNAADAAMYDAKHAGRNKVCFDPKVAAD
ncbi:diguanylate cyclase [Roseibium sp. SCPC15]|uniref:diguanylate cyclase n=1 Tax=Roseibium sp. SCP15 TaxID=3141376 RepID=UPI003337ECE6